LLQIAAKNRTNKRLANSSYANHCYQMNPNIQ